MTIDQNKALVRRFLDLLSKKKLDEAFTLVTSDFTDHMVPPEMGMGMAGIRKFYEMQYEAFPDIKMTIDDMLADGDEVVVRGSFWGTNTGPLMGMPATGRSANWSYINIFCITDGMICEHWNEMDSTGLMRQLGITQIPQSRGNMGDMSKMKDEKMGDMGKMGEMGKMKDQKMGDMGNMQNMKPS